MENNRLRAELNALNKQCQKLRAERDTAMESSYLATERATALEQVINGFALRCNFCRLNSYKV